MSFKRKLLWLWIEILIFLRIMKVCKCGDIFYRWKFKKSKNKSLSCFAQSDDFNERLKNEKLCPICQSIYYEDE